MALTDSDLKILWSRAAGLCSFPDCRELLVRFSKAQDGMYQIGEMAHLVAKRIKGPRGQGPLSMRARDSYKNHILLCPTCHTEIDKNYAGYNVEQLASFKMQHEHWVAQTLLEHLGDKVSFLKFYSTVLRKIETYLHLDKWNWMIDHLWRDLAPAEVMENADVISMLLLQSVWPGNRPRLEDTFKAVMQCWLDYCANFESDAEYRNANFMVSSHIQPWMKVKMRRDMAEKEREWSKRNGDLLFEYTKSLNRLIGVVREELQPTFRQEEGYFLIYDSLGYRNGNQSIIIRPE